MKIARTHERDRGAWIGRGGEPRARSVDVPTPAPQAQRGAQIGQIDARCRRPCRGAGQGVGIDAAIGIKDAKVAGHAVIIAALRQRRRIGPPGDRTMTAGARWLNAASGMLPETAFGSLCVVRREAS
jgi:hypothetical protein